MPIVMTKGRLTARVFAVAAVMLAACVADAGLATETGSRPIYPQIPSGTYVRLSTVQPRAHHLSGLFAANTAVSNIYVNANGDQITGPPIDTGKPAPKNTVAHPFSAPVINAVTSTGPYRRVYSTPGHNYLYARLVLPCRAAHLFGDANNHDVESGYVYTGGWGSTGAGQGIDAGFMKSSWQDGSDKDAYSLFILYKGTMIVKQKKTDLDLPRYKCDAEVDMVFAPESNQVIGVTAVGTDVDGNARTEHLSVPLAAGDGWGTSSAGSETDGAVVKRMTTIGQPDRPGGLPKSPFDLHLTSANATWETDGSYFGVAPDTSKPTVAWERVMIGSIVNGVLRRRSWDKGDTSGCHNVPSRKKTLVRYIDAADEYDGITLSGGPTLPTDDRFSCT